MAVSGGRRGRCVLMAIPSSGARWKRRKRRRAGAVDGVGWWLAGCSLMALFDSRLSPWGGGWGRSREAAAAGGRQQPRSGGSSSREAAAGRLLGLGLQAGRVVVISRRGWLAGRLER